ncbi:phosphodiester glycosidase family protein [Actinoplanes sp. NPDC049548]|uniref:phosphodiester glycosidase family protein n=1 Tax=Actinoplanes sp. NPDC049548 TaxID=3155152 RepID=UPI0034254597
MTRRAPLPLIMVFLAGPVAVATPAVAAPGGALPLGPAGLEEVRTTRTLQPGVTLTRIVRGHADPSAVWTVEVAIPAGAGSPDPDAPPAAISSEGDARATAGRLLAAGLDPRVEQVETPPLADFSGVLGWRVRVGTTATKPEADALRQRVIAAGFAGSTVYTGWDGEPDDVGSSTGPWHVDVLTIDPRGFHGRLDATYGPDLEQRETTSRLAALEGADAAVNAGFFVLDPAAGAPGDPAGAGAYDGRLVSEPVAGRPALVLRDDARRTSIKRLRWRGEVAGLALDGLNRVPGLIRNCGGTGDAPTDLPLHDVTCTDPDELIAFDGSYGTSTPSGPGAEVVLDRGGRVIDIRPVRGTTVPAGGRTVQGTGAKADALLAAAHRGRRLIVRASLVDEDGRPVPTPRPVSIVNGGPELVRDGRVHATPAADGMIHPGEPSFAYGWVHKRNPRTFVGVDAKGRTVLVTADGRSTSSVGLGIAETAAVARSLGLRDAMNLDGGGSTTMVAGGAVINVPSDASGERPVGDALVVCGAYRPNIAR